MQFENVPKAQMFNVINMQGGQAYHHIQPGPAKLGCDGGSIKGRFDVCPHR